MGEEEFVLTDKGRDYLQSLRYTLPSQKPKTRDSADHAILGLIEAGWTDFRTDSPEVRHILRRLYEAGYIDG